MTVKVIKGSHALALHIRKILLECGTFGPWTVRRADKVSKCADQWCVDVTLSNANAAPGSSMRCAIIGVGPQEHIHIAADEPVRTVMHDLLCECLAASGVRPRMLCGE